MFNHLRNFWTKKKTCGKARVDIISYRKNQIFTLIFSIKKTEVKGYPLLNEKKKMPKPTVEVDFLGKEVTIDNDGTIEFEDKLTAEIISKMRGEYLRKVALEKMDKN